MGVRIKRYEKQKKEKRKRIQRIIITIFFLIVLFYGIKIVDQSFKELLCVDEMEMFEFKKNNNTYILEVFGKNYILEEDKLQKITKQTKEKLNVIKLKLEEILFY